MICRSCQASFAVEDDGTEFSLSRWVRFCPPCSERLTAQHEEEDRQRRSRALEARWAKICPEEYRDTDLSDPRIPGGFLAAANAWSVTGRKGLGFIGDVGTCKTRLLYHALHRAFMAGLWTHAISHVRFRKVALSAVSGDGEERSEAKRRLEMLSKVDVLFFDDVGKAATGESTDSEFIELVEVRTAARRPLLWSSNMGGARLEERFGADRGPALLRRLCEYCTVVKL